MGTCAFLRSCSSRILSKQVWPVFSLPPIWLGGWRVSIVETDSPAGRIWRSRKLLDEVAHASLDLLYIAFDGVHTAFELDNPFDLVKPIQKHLAKYSRRPLPKPSTLKRLHPISNRNDNIKVLQSQWAPTLFGGFMQNLHKTLSRQLSFSEDVRDMSLSLAVFFKTAGTSVPVSTKPFRRPFSLQGEHHPHLRKLQSAFPCFLSIFRQIPNS